MPENNSSNKFSYKKAQYELIPCSICGAVKNTKLAFKDRNRLAVTTVTCNTCGLIFINPRMTKSFYDLYYQDEYRSQAANYKGLFLKSDIELYYNPEALYKKAIKHGEKIFEEIATFLQSGLTIEVGSSSGGILASLKQKTGNEVLGIEPSREEADFAIKQGIPIIISLFEDVNDLNMKAQMVMCIRSLNHILSPRKFLEWSHNHLNKNGRVVIEVMNFYALVRRFKYLPIAVQIDHVYMFTPITLRTLVESAGFKVLYINTDQDENKEHILLVAEKIEVPNSQISFNDNKEIKKIQNLENSFWKYQYQYGLKRTKKRIKAKIRSVLYPLKKYF